MQPSFFLILLLVTTVQSIHIHIWKNDLVHRFLIGYYKDQAFIKNPIHLKRFEGSEHKYIENKDGYLTTIVGAKDEDIIYNPNNNVIPINVSLSTFKFKNNQTFDLGTYGDIVSYAGDFFGSTSHQYICSGADAIEQRNLFQAIWLDFWTKIDQSYLNEVKVLLQKEFNILDEGLKQKKTPNVIFQELGVGRYLYELMSNTWTIFRPLLFWNLDHFGSCAVIAYSVGHQLAIEMAQDAGSLLLQLNQVTLDIRGNILNQSKIKLEEAYAMNAFADHYLTDLFSAGHVRTPRKALTQQCSNIGEGGQMAQWMHDEDNRNGLWVKNEMNNTWKTYGDDNFFSNDNNGTWPIILKAVQISRNEIYDAFLNKSTKDFKALKLIPQPSFLPLFEQKNTCPLFKVVETYNANVKIRYPNEAIIPENNTSDPCPNYKIMEKEEGCANVYVDLTKNWLWGTPLLKQLENSTIYIANRITNIYSLANQLELVVFLNVVLLICLSLSLF